jgi:uncharacterized membrane protein
VTGQHRAANERRLIAASIILGVGLGGLFDGIVVHQILQWHHLISSRTPADTVPNLELNTLADGAFHAAAWLVTVVGVLVLVSSNGARHQDGGTRTLIAGMVGGWGGFNLVEGLIDHQILGLHHVRPGPDWLAYDLGFLVLGALMLVAGLVAVRRIGSGRPRSGAVED